MKKIISLLLLLSICLGLICSCGNATTTICDGLYCPCKHETEDTENWKPRDDEPWYFSPGFPTGLLDPCSMYEFDLEFSLTQTEFVGVPEYIECTIVNKTGDPAMCYMLFIEKDYPNIYDIYNTVTMETTVPAWVRVPFMANGYVLEDISDNTKSGKIYLEKYLKAEYEFTPGFYRLVIFLYDGTTRYLNFSIYEE